MSMNKQTELIDAILDRIEDKDLIWDILDSIQAIEKLPKKASAEIKERLVHVCDILINELYRRYSYGEIGKFKRTTKARDSRSSKPRAGSTRRK